MIQLPEEFNLALLFSDLFRLAAPFVGLAFLISTAFLINKIIRNAS